MTVNRWFIQSPFVFKVNDLYQTVSINDLPDGSGQQTIWLNKLHKLLTIDVPLCRMLLGQSPAGPTRELERYQSFHATLRESEYVYFIKQFL